SLANVPAPSPPLRIPTWERPESFGVTGICGSELVREGFIPDDTSSADVPALSRTMRMAAPVAPTGTLSKQPTNLSTNQPINPSIN
ncbi:hypothetical protein RYB07_27500, partial [Pseudomonas syringae pv. actinidifoliorum]|nr:hypothetical protein [Pseudomonas syringae pv. actinidifoliorum]